MASHSGLQPLAGWFSPLYVVGKLVCQPLLGLAWCCFTRIYDVDGLPVHLIHSLAPNPATRPLAQQAVRR